MIKKIGRNAPCPCGSGKKYKHCCMLVEQAQDYLTKISHTVPASSSLNAPIIIAYLEQHQAAPLLDYLIALQLNPANHGKNLRIEHLSQLTVAALGKGIKKPSFEEFKLLIDEEYPYDVMEDMPFNLYTENVVFFGGNYTFFPGLSTHATELFRAMTEAIFHKSDGFPESFNREVYYGIMLMLELGELIACRGNIRGMIRGNDNPRELIKEPLTNNIFAILEKMMSEFLRLNRLSRDTLVPFLLDRNDPKLLTDNSDENPILYHPIVKNNGIYYFVGISNQGCAINNFILKTAVKHDCLRQLVETTHYDVWMRLGAACINYLHWGEGTFSDILKSDRRTLEDIFQIDVNWLAYVYYATDSASDVALDGVQGFVSGEIDIHLKTTLDEIRKDERVKDFHILTLVLYSSMGETFNLMIGDQSESDYLLCFSAFEFLQLVQTEKWDNMSLVRYARTKAAYPSLMTSYNQEIDTYSVYKHYGESFYMSDEAKPDWMQIVPNDGCHLIFESKEKLNFHGTPQLFGDKLAYVPVQRDLDDANVYEPILSAKATKSCESYQVPLWVTCSQTETDGQNPSSIIETVITAVAYWMEILSPSIDALVTEHFQKPVTIEVSFDEKTLANKDLQYDEMVIDGKGELVVTKSDSRVSVHLNHDYVLSFLGSNNEAEREMMHKIISVLLDLDDKDSLKIIDEHIPFGNAKMILMTEASNNPVTFPLWLRPPIYIHESSRQLLLDQFPKWMKEGGSDIEGKLEEKKQKEEFLHTGVDILLAKLNEKLKQFDTQWLLRMLINNHDTLVFQREHNRMLQPAQILCFGDSDEKRKEFNKEEKRLTDAGLSTRALIELLAATQDKTGSTRPGTDDIETLLAIMNEIVSIGGICDAIHLDVADYTIEKLSSGRYGIYEDKFNDCTGGFAFARTVERINEDIEDFDNKMDRFAIMHPRTDITRDEKYDVIDSAFLADWGISYSNILQFLYSCYVIAMEQQKTEVEMLEADLLQAIQKKCPDLTDKLAKKSLDRLSLDKRKDYLTPPEGMEGKDIFPWSYNRELSYLRRPIVRYVLDDGQVLCMFAFRSCLQAGVQLSDLLFSGRLKKGGKQIESLLGQFEADKGREFNEIVRNYLKKIPELKVWPHDVTMKQRGNFDAEDNYGDIDVLAYDTSRNILYSIECKNTNTAKNVKEMKTEMDEYLGRGINPEKDKKKALVLKHLRRHKWLQDNVDMVKKFVGVLSETEITIKSMMLTASVIPTSYLKKEESPLSILNYSELKLKGLEYLDSCKEPDVSFLH